MKHLIWVLLLLVACAQPVVVDVIEKEFVVAPIVESILVHNSSIESVAREALGSVELYSVGESYLVRFVGLDTELSAGVVVFLGVKPDNSDVVELGSLLVRGDVNFDVPKGVDIDKYRYVVVWSAPLGEVLFYAPLQ